MKTKQEETRKEIGIQLKELREKRGISLYRVEKETKLNFNTLKTIETGNLNYTLDNLITYLKAINARISFELED